MDMTEPKIWEEAVRTRDATFDGVFVYAVQTTGVYCRPGCPSRAARPQNIRYFSSPQAAEAAGFRACKKCHPATQLQPNDDAIARACRAIKA
jgi:AraC family transcriptional regulator of adaptative response/methylated-DNA-[protein]-cysteine methyltransferase